MVLEGSRIDYDWDVRLLHKYIITCSGPALTSQPGNTGSFLGTVGGRGRARLSRYCMEIPSHDARSPAVFLRAGAIALQGSLRQILVHRLPSSSVTHAGVVNSTTLLILLQPQHIFICPPRCKGFSLHCAEVSSRCLKSAFIFYSPRQVHILRSRLVHHVYAAHQPVNTALMSVPGRRHAYPIFAVS